MSSVPLDWTTEGKLQMEVSLEYCLDRNTASEGKSWGRHKEVKLKLCSMDTNVIPV